MDIKSRDDLIDTLIVDSAAFLKNVAVQSIARNVFTVNEVISEIRSSSVRQALAVLPYEINFRVPSSESLHVVSEFAKKTGDYLSLSIVDLKVLALAYQLRKEKCGTEGLRMEPTKQVEVVDKQLQGKIPGFFVKSKNQSEKEGDKHFHPTDEETKLVEQISDCLLNEKNAEETVIDTEELTNPLKNSQAAGEMTCENGSVTVQNNNKNMKVVNKSKNEDHADSANISHVKDDCSKGDADHDDCDKDDDGSDDDDHDNDNNYNDDDDDDDDDDWITPGNISQVKTDMGMSETESKPTNVIVGCLTTDFAMQNVLIQMGLDVISVDGMLIKEARSYVLKCYSCFKVTTQMQRLFCPKCGNRTLIKVSVSVDKDGITHYHMRKRTKPFNIRGKKHPLPMPKGGRHSNNPLLFEDQLISQKRLPKVKDKVNVLDQDYVARSSPFAVNNTTSRAFNLGFHIHGKSRQNPNEAHKKTRRKK